MHNELELVVLKRDIPKEKLIAGDIGTIVHKYDESHFEIEFVTASGHTIAVLPLSDNEVRPFSQQEILHTREMSTFAA